MIAKEVRMIRHHPGKRLLRNTGFPNDQLSTSPPVTSHTVFGVCHPRPAVIHVSEQPKPQVSLPRGVLPC